MNPEPKPNEDESDPDLARSIRRHIAVQWSFEIAGSMGAPAVWVLYKFQTELGIGSSVTEGAVFFGLFVLGDTKERTRKKGEAYYTNVPSNNHDRLHAA